MEGLYKISSELLFGLLIFNLILTTILLVYALLNGSKIKRLKSKYNRFMSGVSEGNIEEILIECIDRMNRVETKNREIENKLNSIERNILACVQKVGIVRFNAFDDVGSDLSFSVALLNDNDDGVVLSGIYSRESSCTYAKPVMSGNSKYVLSAEEIKAIDIAKKSGRSFIHS